MAFSAVSAQVPTKRIRGQVTDKQTTATLPGVNILVENSDPLIGSASDPDGYFVLKMFRWKGQPCPHIYLAMNQYS